MSLRRESVAVATTKAVVWRLLAPPGAATLSGVARSVARLWMEWTGGDGEGREMMPDPASRLVGSSKSPAGGRGSRAVRLAVLLAVGRLLACGGSSGSPGGGPDALSTVDAGVAREDGEPTPTDLVEPDDLEGDVALAPDDQGGADAGADAIGLPTDERLTFWYEDSDLDRLEAFLPYLRRHELAVHIGLHEGEVRLEALDRFLAAAAAHEVPVGVWPLLHPDDGYFPNVRNAEAFAAFWFELLDHVAATAPWVRTFVADVEPPLSFLREVQRLLTEGADLAGLVAYLQERYDPAIYAAGSETLREMVVATQERGFAVHASTLFLVLDDLQDGDDTIQRAFDTPIEAIPWDEVSFQVYRSSFGDLLEGTLLQAGEQLSSYVVYDYGRTAKERFGERAALDIGIVADEGYRTPDALAADVGAAFAAGYPPGRINVYSLQGVMAEETEALADAWVELPGVSSDPPPEDARVSLLRAMIQSLDASVTLPTEVIPPPCPSEAALAAPAVGGLVFEDGDRSETSFHDSQMDPERDAPLTGITVRLLEGDAERSTETCADGRFSFGALPDGAYLLDPDLPAARPATTTNRAPHFAAAVRDGAVRIVSLGDSIPVYSPARPFPDRLASLIEPLAAVDSVNVAVAGSTSDQWLVGGYHHQRVADNVPDADVVVISLGGNDILDYFGWIPATMEEAMALLEGLPAVIEQVQQNVLALIADVRERAPQADVVYCIYPNYAGSAYFMAYAGQYSGLVDLALPNLLRAMRARFAAVEGIVLADIWGATQGTDITHLLIDPLHLSDQGADLYAEQILLALGGALVGEHAAGLERRFGFAPAAE